MYTNIQIINVCKLDGKNTVKLHEVLMMVKYDEESGKENQVHAVTCITKENRIKGKYHAEVIVCVRFYLRKA